MGYVNFLEGIYIKSITCATTFLLSLALKLHQVLWCFVITTNPKPPRGEASLTAELHQLLQTLRPEVGGIYFRKRTLPPTGMVPKMAGSIWMFPKIVGFPSKSSILMGVFHYFHHPFWGFSLFLVKINDTLWDQLT